VRNSLKKELAILGGIGSLLLWRRKTPMAAALAFASVGLLSSSMSKGKTLRGKSVLITGGSRGLGFALAQEFLRIGARVTIIARQAEELHRAQALLIKQFPDAQLQLLATDVTDKPSLDEAILSAVGQWQGLDILINNAGAITVGPFETMEREDFESQLELHFFSVLESTLAVLPVFRHQGHGHIVNICSLGGKVAVPHMLPYDTSKFALAGFSQGLNAELAVDNIQVTTVYPTVMSTGSPIQAVFKGNHEKEYAWFASADNFPGLSLSPVQAAVQIIDAIRTGKSELVPSIAGKARIAMGALFPELTAMTMRWIARMLPTGKSHIRKTGAQSRRIFDYSFWSRPLRNREKAAEALYNQEPSTNPAFNLGLWE
jgi:short-subunit dehydrogenase